MITNEGYILKTINEIRQEIINEISTDFPTLNFEPDSFEGHLVDNVADRLYKIEQTLQALFNNTPKTATGIALDSFCKLKGINRIQATPSIVSITVLGVENTIIPESFTVRDIRQGFDFRPVASVEITTPCTENKFMVVFNRVPSAGTWSVEIDGVTETYNFDETTPTHAKCFDITGNYVDGFKFEMDDNYGEDLEINTSAVFNAVASLIVTELDNLYMADVLMFNTLNGAYTTSKFAVNEIITPVLGVDFVFNENNATEGTFRENDEELYSRFEETTLANGNSIEGIKNRLLQLINEKERFDIVKKVIIKEHFGTGATGAPNPLEIFVSGGETKGYRIAEIIRLYLVSAGIELLGEEDYTVIDSDGFEHKSKFSRIAGVDIYANLSIEIDSSFPGIDVAKQAIVEWGNNLKIGQDVIRIPGLVNALCKIPGILNITLIELSTNGMTYLEENIEIDAYEESKWQLDNIEITVI